MKINFLLVTLIIIIVSASSCSSAYKTTQTPDDVYYSPVRLQTDNVKRDDKNVNDNSVYAPTNNADVRVRVRNRRYRRYDDGYDYPYGNYPYNNGYPVYRNPKYGAAQNQSQPKKTNLGAYKPNTTKPDSTVIYNPKLGNQSTGTTTAPVRTFGKPTNSSNNGSGVGNFIRKVLSGDNNSYHNNNNTYNSGTNNNSSPSRTFDTRTSSSSSSSSSSTPGSSSSSSSSAPVRTFGKDKN